MITPERVEARLAVRPRRLVGGELRPAAVLVGLLERAGEAHVLLTRRSENLRVHSGQYAFPGGARDADDADAVATALREAHEEIGLRPGDVRVLGLLDDHPTITGYVVTPVVGWVPHPYEYAPSPHEVALVAELPLRAFLQPRRAYTLRFEHFRRIVLAFDVEGHFIWGATASILASLAELLED